MNRWIAILWVLGGLVAMDAPAEEEAGANTQPSAEKELPADTNDDGKVSKEEFLAQAEKNADKAGKAFNPKRAESIFAKKDINQDGFLTADDAVEATDLKAEEGADTAAP